jgi:hypothetical protein
MGRGAVTDETALAVEEVDERRPRRRRSRTRLPRPT